MAKRYSSVEQMVREKQADAPKFAEEMLAELRKQDLVNHLFALRCATGMTQKDVAEHMGCSQSRVSKLQTLDDGQMPLEDVVDDASAVGYSVEIALVQNE